MSDETEKMVKVLYDYKYPDGGGQVQIKAGDLYRLIERTNSEWWKVRDPSDADRGSFFVPADYVKVIQQELEASSHSGKLLVLDETCSESFKSYPGGADEGEYSSVSELRSLDLLSKEKSGEDDVNDNGLYVNTSYQAPDARDDGEYVNLDQFRQAAGIKSLSVEDISGASGKDQPPKTPTKPPTVPQELIQGTIPPPLPEEGRFIRVLAKDLPWDIYKENTLGRLYYVNRETGERMWKPPRKANPSPDQPRLPAVAPAVHVTNEWSGIPSEYEQVHENGSIYFIHRATQEKERSQSPARLLPQRPTNLSAPNSAASLQPPQTVEPIFINSDVYEGYLNKTKIVDISKKKVKKSWTQVYVVLQGSNLVFYKDQKSAQQKQGSPHGKPDSVVSLQGARVDLNPKELSSKKNTISLRVSAGNVYLFQSDSEKENFEWFTRMKLVANDMSPAEPSPRDFDVLEVKKERGFLRSVSGDEIGLQNVDKNKNLVGIRAKLFNLISRRPTQEDLYKRGIIKDAVFGSHLRELCEKEKVDVPKFVHRCIIAVESRGLNHDGLYRISGNMSEIQRLRCTVDKDDTYDLCDEQWDIYVLAGALKLFFRELKEPVFPYHMYDTFLDAIKKETRKEKLAGFKSAVQDLPKCNYATLKELFLHLCKVMGASHKNRMQSQNIAIVFGPTLLWQQESTECLAIQTVFQSKIVEFMLLEYNELFK